MFQKTKKKHFGKLTCENTCFYLISQMYIRLGHFYSDFTL